MALAALVPALASPMLAASVLPSSLHALRVLSRSMSTFSSVTAPVPASDSDKQKGVSSTWECLVGPLEKHMVETRTYKSGVMPQSAVFVSPLVRHSVTLMGAAWERNSSSSSSSHSRRSYSGLLEAASRRHYTAVPEVALAGSTRGAHSAALVPEDLLPEARPGILATWAGKVQPRFKGGVRKLVLRQINRKIIARMARRFTIGIPVVGFYFVSKLLRNDFRRVTSEFSAGNTAVSGLFAAAMVADILDLAAQATIIAGFAHNNFNMGIAAAAAVLAHADMASLACAALSFTSGLSGELLSLSRAAANESGLESS